MLALYVSHLTETKQAEQLQHTFEQQWKKRNLWCLHLLEGVPVGFVIQGRIL